VGVSVQDITGTPATLDEYHQASVAQLAGMVSDISYSTDTKTTFAGRTGYLLIYSGTMSGYSIRILQCFTIVDDLVYLFTYTALSDSYDLYLDRVNAMMDSITIQ
jgi:serine/threonine-protein kinase